MPPPPLAPCPQRCSAMSPCPTKLHLGAVRRPGRCLGRIAALLLLDQSTALGIARPLKMVGLTLNASCVRAPHAWVAPAFNNATLMVQTEAPKH